MIFNSIVWDLKPEIFSIGSYGVRWYGLLFALGFVFGYYIIQRMFKREGIKQEVLDSLTMYMFLGTILGARLGHCFFYEPGFYFSHPLEIIKVWKGGLASHGAAVGILISLYIFARKHKKTYFWILDRIVVVVALAGALIRTGNLMNSEIYGHVTTLPWGFIFENEGETLPKHPTQIYEAICYLISFGILIWSYRKGLSQKPGTIFGMFLILIFAARFFIEFVKETQVEFEKTMSLNMGQWLSIPFVLTGILVLYLAQQSKTNKI